MDISHFAKTHISQITATIGLVTYASARKKLTPGGILAGIFVAVIGHNAKSHLTQSSTGGTGGEGARRSAQVFANSGFACLLILLHAWLLNSTPFISSNVSLSAGPHLPALQRLFPIGIIAQYAAVAADTFSSELGILSRGDPFMITAPWRKVPKGTNGGVSVDGLAYGVLGSLLLTLVAGAAVYLAPPKEVMDAKTAGLLVGAGLAGSVIDSVLGAVVQVTVTDKRSGKVVEGAGGQRVKVLPDGTRVQIGTDLLTNNGVNFVMAALASLLAMGVAHEFGLGLTS
ncbi:hypothetical protein PRZ48_014413 [Zasmidium cellare]|uniref:Transmembrane protein 19 n=1 Tax=Zasmidium cellare TaxID=395010 RepID=A0ABR0DY64_ZASCE|nr:hypothetical protein PRZ48_014413 [Zasmidium cellare]